MSPAARKTLYQSSVRINGPEHPLSRARFGRYAGSKDRILSAVGSGAPAWVACYRELGHAGFRNRTWRRHMERSLTHNWAGIKLTYGMENWGDSDDAPRPSGPSSASVPVGAPTT